MLNNYREMRLKSKYTKEQIIEIRKNRIDGYSYRDLANQYKASSSTIHAIINGVYKTYHPSIKEKFEKYIDLIPFHTCWEWNGSLDRQGYGKITYKTITSFAHRVSFAIYKGKIPKGMNVCHTCDNTHCVNPNHLFLGTTIDNINDKMNKNRQAKGEQQGSHKLTENEVLEIRNKYIPYKYHSGILAEEYKVSKTTISLILKNKAWRHI